jgi:subtilisin-like proprotein convertase family protein
MKKTLLLLLLCLLFQQTNAQTFIGGGGPIPDNQTPIFFPLTVTGVPQTALSSNFGIESVCLDITHGYVGDLNIFLIAPDNTYIELTTGNGGGGQNYFNTCLTDLSPNLISAGSAPFTGSFRPESPLYVVNNGLNPNGQWQLYILDSYPQDAGILNSWSITFGPNTGQPFPFTSSNLPIVKINTMGNSIVDEPKVMANMQIIDNGAGIRNYITDTVYTYDGHIGIEVRGSSSQTFPKKSFGFETWDSAGVEIDTSILGFPKESDWILNANYTDKSFLRNVTPYHLFNQMGRYASRTKYVEVFINNVYAGLYVFMEKVKRDNNRVDISNLTPLDTSAIDITGGYILKVDKATGSGGTGGFNSAFPPVNNGTIPEILYDYPDDGTITPQQSNYIQAFVDSFEQALHGPQFTDPINGYYKYINDSSFIDFFLINELSKNVDGYRISSYLYKEKITKGNRLNAGPVWDYDIAFGNADYCGGQYQTGWSYTFNCVSTGFQVPFWWARLLNDPVYANKMKCRYTQLRSTIFTTAYINNFIDSIALYLQESQDRNFQQWPILGTYVWPNPSPIPTTYSGEITKLKNWISTRLFWLDLNLPGTCTSTGLEAISNNSSILVYPNPANDYITVKSEGEPIEEYLLYNINGQLIDKGMENFTDELTIPLTNVKAGVYFLHTRTHSELSVSRFVVE